MVYKMFNKKAASLTGTGIVSEAVPENYLCFWGSAWELQKPIIRKCKKRKVCLSFKDNILSTDIPGMQWISTCIKIIQFLLWIIYNFRKYTWVVSLQGKKGVMITNAFQKTLD